MSTCLLTLAVYSGQLLRPHMTTPPQLAHKARKIEPTPNFTQDKAPYHFLTMFKNFIGSKHIHVIALARTLQTQKSKRLSLLYLILVLFATAFDIETHPGPLTETTDSTRYECGMCEKTVGWDDRAVCCDNCSIWYHINCQNIKPTMYECLHSSNISWVCLSCGIPNFSSTLFNNTNFETINSFAPLDVSNAPSTPLSPGAPQFASSPIHTKTRTSYKNPVRNVKTKNNPLRILIINFQSISNKKNLLHSLIESSKPDVIIGSETWLKEEIKSQEIFPDNFQVFRKDRIVGIHGGVLVAIDKKYMCTEEPELEVEAELVWVRVNLVGHRALYIGAFYRSQATDGEYLEQIDHSLSRIANTNGVILLGGDFNCPSIDWPTTTLAPNPRYPAISQQLMDIADDHSLTQVVDKPTRGNNTLDLLFTNNSSIVNRVETLPKLGQSDHDVVFVEINIKPETRPQKPRKIFLYKKADYEAIKEDLQTFQLEFEQLDHETYSTNDLWEMFKKRVQAAIDKHIPTKMAKYKNGFPWIDRSLKSLIRRLKRNYKQKFKSEAQKSHYRKFKNHVQKTIRSAYWKYIDEIITPPSTEDPSPSQKRFWTFIKSFKRDNSGVSPLKEQGTLVSDAKGRANILNRQFKSAFTQEPPGEIPDKGPSPHPKMPNFTITPAGINKLLSNLKVHKASGPDNINARILREMKDVIAPVLSIIYNHSLETGCVPQDWRNANVAPIYKKGERFKASNYRPVSLTCICSKVMEHVVVSQIMNHMDKHDLFYKWQHGFRPKLSCETQLVTMVHDLARNMSKGLQTDVIVTDFSKAFDKVPHRRLASKLEYYGIRGRTNTWISSFLADRYQKVVVEGDYSDTVSVDSGVPQGSVLGPVLFLIYINDIPDGISSGVRLFADDCILYRPINTQSDALALQADLDTLDRWCDTWLMDLNPIKCHTLRVHRSKSPIIHDYKIQGVTLEAANNICYLGVTITSDLTWNRHIEQMANKANQTLGMIRRNLRNVPAAIKSKAYIALVRPKLEYASSVWDPHTQKNINTIEKVQRRAARFVCNSYFNKSSVTNMINTIGWPTLQHRRTVQRLCMLYKMSNHFIAIPATEYLQPAIRLTRGMHVQSYIRIQATVNYYSFSFFPRTVAQWNALPLNAISASTPDTFRGVINPLDFTQRPFIY